MARAQRLFKDRARHLVRGTLRRCRRDPEGQAIRQEGAAGHRTPPADRNGGTSRPISVAILNIDPPDHTRIRALLTKAFSAPRIEAMRPTIETLVDSILERIVAGRSEGRAVDVMREFAFPIPATIISDMLGIPAADRERFAKLSNAIIEFGTGIAPGIGRSDAARQTRAHRDDRVRRLSDGAVRRQAPCACGRSDDRADSRRRRDTAS